MTGKRPRTPNGSDDEKALRARAISEAAEMYRADGILAIQKLILATQDPTASATVRRRLRLTRVEVERLHRTRNNVDSTRAMVVWKPPLFSVAGLARLFGFGPRSN